MYTGVERRQYKRIKKNFIARFQIKPPRENGEWPGEWNMVTMRNLGAGGALFNYNEKLKIDLLLRLKINFPLEKEPIDCIGKITRVEDTFRSVIFRIAVTFMKISEREREIVNKAAEEFYVRKPGQIEF